MMQGLRWRILRGPVAPLFLSAVLLPSLVVSSCSSSAEPELEVMLDLERAALRWERRGPEDYVFIYHQVCECLPPPTVVLTVEDGDVIGAAALPGETPPLQPDPRAYLSIEELFERLRSNAAADPVRFKVVFDRELGYPVSADVDVSAEIADDEYTFTVRELAAVEPLS